MGLFLGHTKKFFQHVKPKEIVLRILNISKIEFTVALPEKSIPLIRQVEKLEVTFDAFPKHTIPAAIKEIGVEASIYTRTYPVTLIFDQSKDILILPGMTGNTVGGVKTTIRYGKAEGFFIPVSAIFSNTDETYRYVWTVSKNMTLHKRAINIEQLSKHGALVNGLKAGEIIVIAGVHELEEDQKIRILQNESN